MEQNNTPKPSIQLEDYPLLTEISEQVYKQLMSSPSKYLYFDEIKRSITIKKAFFKKNKQIPNVVRYLAQVNESDIHIHQAKRYPLLDASQFEDDIMAFSPKLKTIAIILESPHVDEYTLREEKLIPIAAAQGTIGRKIEANIEKLLWNLKRESLLKDELYRIVIMNAIPYQTSLYHIHQKNMDNSFRELRDKIWIKMWSEISSIRNEFNKQINSFKKDSILINSCTKSIKPFINQELVRLQHKFFLLESFIDGAMGGKFVFIK